MAFQMGIQGLFSFKRALKAVEDGDWVDILPSLKEGDSRYCYQELSASQTVAASPAANMFLAAFMSRSWWVLHSGHVHCLLESGIFASTCPQFEQRLLDGYHLSIPISSRPYQRALYSSCLRNSDQLASDMDLDRWRFFCMFFTDNVSTAIAWFSRIKRVESLCRKSLRVSAIFACKRATFLRALVRLFEPFCFLLRRRCPVQAKVVTALPQPVPPRGSRYTCFDPGQIPADCLQPRASFHRGCSCCSWCSPWYHNWCDWLCYRHR